MSQEMRVIIMPSCYLKPELTVARIAQHGSVSAEMMFVICLHKKRLQNHYYDSLCALASPPHAAGWKAGLLLWPQGSN